MLTRLSRVLQATGVHDASSRSHAICRVHVQRGGEPLGNAGCMTLVDLAGSEQRIDSEKHSTHLTKQATHAYIEISCLQRVYLWLCIYCWSFSASPVL